MSFLCAGIRPAVFGSALALVFAFSASTALAQDAQPEVTPAPASSTMAPAVAEVPVADGPVKPGDATAGQAKAAVCGACHGMDGNSAVPIYPNLAGQSEQYIAQQLASFKSGRRDNAIMMGMAAPLSAQDMNDLGAFYATLKTTPGVADQALVEHGQTLFRQGDSTRDIPACMACHSIDGRGNPGSMYPQLAGQHAEYIEAMLKAWQAGDTWGDDVRSQIMPTIAKQLNEQDIAAVSSYIEGLHSADAKPAATP